MDATNRAESTPLYGPGDISATLEMRLPLQPAPEQIAPPEELPPSRWKRRKPNVLTEADKKRIYRKMPQGWEPLSDANIWALNPEMLHNITGAHITTCRRWLKSPPPELVVRLACILIDGDLGAISEQWRGWRVTQQGNLVSPEQWEFTPGAVRASYLDMTLDRARRWSAEVRAREAEQKLQLATQADFIEQRWVVPGEHTAPTLAPGEGTSAAVVQQQADEEQERLRKKRFFYWRERERRNNAMPGGNLR